jgi:hypothetical protein
MRVRECPKTPSQHKTKNMEHKSSMHVNIAQGNSEAHNKREEKLDYVYEDLTKNNESWELSTISNRLNHIKEHCLKQSGRKLQKNAEPIREAVVNIKSTTTMTDLIYLSERLKKELKIEVFQIHIHRDEGKSRDELNNHAHLVIDWQDKDKGTTLKFNKQGLSEMQNIVSEMLDMERGKTSDKKHLMALQYKNEQEALKLAELKLKTAELSTKLENLTKDTGEVSNRLEATKTELSNEVDKFAKAKDLNNSIESNAKTFIEKSFFGIDVEKTTENISELLAANAQFKKDNTILKNEVGVLNREISELRDVKQELNAVKHLVAISILNNRYKLNGFNEWQKEKIINDTQIQNFINTNNKAFERRAAELTRDPSKGL